MTFAHVVERRRLRLYPRVFSAGEEKFETRIANNWSGQAYSAGWSFAGSEAPVASSADLRLTALIFPRLSCCRS